MGSLRLFLTEGRSPERFYARQEDLVAALVEKQVQQRALKKRLRAVFIGQTKCVYLEEFPGAIKIAADEFGGINIPEMFMSMIHWQLVLATKAAHVDTDRFVAANVAVSNLGELLKEAGLLNTAVVHSVLMAHNALCCVKELEKRKEKEKTP